MLLESNKNTVKLVAEKLRLGILQEMVRSNWPVTASIGVVTFEEFPESVREVIQMADDLMYSVKRSGKDRVEYRIWTHQLTRSSAIAHKMSPTLERKKSRFKSTYGICGSRK